MAKTSDLLVRMNDLDEVLANLNAFGTDTITRQRATRALNDAQDFFESMLAAERDILGSVDDSIAQTVGQEYTALPSRTKRIDSVWVLNSSTSLPQYELEPKRKAGGHREDRAWPLFDISTDTTGKPSQYWWARGSDRLYWDRQPDTTNGIRVVGFFGAADMTITGTDSTFAYGDELIRPFAAVAAELFRFRRRDKWEEMRKFAEGFFRPVVEHMVLEWRHGAGNIRGNHPAW